MDESNFTINPKVYDFLKWVAFTVLPALGTLLAGLGLLLNWGDATSVVGIVTLFDTFLGILLTKSASNLKKNQPDNVLGDLIIQQGADGVATGMRIVGTRENPVFTEGTHVVLNVKREQAVD